MLTDTFGYCLWNSFKSSGKMDSQIDSIVPIVREPVSSEVAATAVFASATVPRIVTA